MGQYYKIINLTKKQYIKPHTFNDGAKLLEFGASGEGTMFGLALLLAEGNGAGGGDAHVDPLIGSWARDQIVIVGDYAESKLYDEVRELPWRDISALVLALVKQNS